MDIRICAVKTVVRCRDIDASRRFYKDVLGLAVVEEWDKAEGKGCILTPGGNDGLIELSQVHELLAPSPRGRSSLAAFSKPFETDKVELQFRTDSLDEWVAHLCQQWEVVGPVARPWGQRYLWLRDPDNLLVALVECNE